MRGDLDLRMNHTLKSTPLPFLELVLPTQHAQDLAVARGKSMLSVSMVTIKGCFGIKPPGL
jgi:hypothetical protein